MANRVQLNDMDLDNVNGGAFNFYTKDDKPMCYVDGVGTYYCSAEASAWIVSHMTSANNMDAVLAEAMEKGLLWK